VSHVLVLGVCSLKGGVGKTSITLGLASAALERGLRTLVIDLDPQGDSTMALGARPQTGDVASVLDDPSAATMADATVLSSWADDGLDVLAGSERSAATRPVRVSPPSEGGQSMSTRSYPLTQDNA